MLNTAKAHFDEDLARARALLSHAQGLPSGMLCDDILRAAWMMGVGACDAYFSDVYADLIARTLRAKDMEPRVSIPDKLNNLKVPVTAILRQSNGGWRWRMAARELIETENVLALDKVRALFNHFFRKKHKLLNQDTIEVWILHCHANSRLFGLTPTQYRAKSVADKANARKDALEQFELRFEEIFQRRHDCIHNCDRPRSAVQQIRATGVNKILQDIEFLVNRCHEAFLTEYPIYLFGLGFNSVTRNQVCL